MKGLSEKDNQFQRYFMKGRSKLQIFVSAVKTRQLKTILSHNKEQTQVQIHRFTHNLQKKSLRNGLRQRKTGMKLSWSLARRNVTRSKYRSALLVLGIILTIALETGIVVSVDTLYDDFIFDNRNQNFTDITIHPKSWHNISTIREISRTARTISGVSKASPVYYAGVNQFLNQPIQLDIYIYGIDSATHPDYSLINITEGKRTIKNQTIVISESIQDSTGVQVGDSLDLASTGSVFESRMVTVGGIMADEPFFGNKLGYLFILVDIDTLYDSIPESQRSVILSSEIDCKVSNLVNIRKTTEAVKDELGVGGYWVFMEKDISDIEATGIRAYQTAMNLVILASFVVEFLFITNILAISIRDRSREFGILRAVGSKSYQLIESVAFEILIYSAIGCTIGVGLGLVFSTFLVGLMDLFYAGLEIQGLSIHFSSISATYVSGIIVALISGLYPIFLAISMPVVQNIHSRMRRGRSSHRWGQSWKYTLITGVLLAVVGFSLQFFIGPSRFLDFEILSVHFLAVLLIFLGTVLLEIGILFFLPKMVLKMMIGFNIITRTISSRNIAREFQKSLFTIMTSAMALTFIIVVGLVSAAVIAGVPDYFQSQWGVVDLVAEARDTTPLNINFTADLDSNIRIERSSFIQESRTEIDEIDGYVFGVDPAKYSFFAEPAVDFTSSFSTYVLLNQTTGNTTNGLISHLLFQKLRTTLGSNISVKIADNSTVNVTLRAVIKSNIFIGNGEYLYIPSIRFQEFFNSTDAKWFVCDVEGDVQRAQAALETGYPELKEVMGITYFTEMIERSLIFQSAIFQVLFIESFILAAIAQFVCILVSTLRMEREVGVMRSFGLNRRGVFGIFMTESIALGISALFVGLIDGLLGSVLLAWYISLSIPIKINFPLENIALWLLISFLITIFSTILPSFRSSRKNVVATISGRPMVKSYTEKAPYAYYKEFVPHGVRSEQKMPLQPQNPMIHRLRPIEEARGDVLPPNIYLTVQNSTSIFQFIRRNIIYIQTIFLILMAIITFNYIFDEAIIIRGLIPFDIIGRLVFTEIMLQGSYTDFDYLLLVNPLLVLVGMILVIPFSYYIIRRENPKSLVWSLLQSFILNIAGIIVLILCLFTLIFIAGVFYIPIQEYVDKILGPDYYLGSLLLGPLLYVLLAFFIIAGIWLFLYQRFWCFIITRGIEPNLPIREHFRLVRRYGSIGATGFVFLLLLHSFFQVVLYYILGPHPQSLIDSFMLLNSHPSLEPNEFLLYSIYEVGFFVLLIVYQLVQYNKYKSVFPEIEPQGVKYEITSPRKLVSRCQNAAERILQTKTTGISIQHNDLQLFSEVRDGNNFLFFQDSAKSIPVAMNYSFHHPEKYVLLPENNSIQVLVPSTSQMELFLEMITELDL